MAFLHYRDAAFRIARAAQAPGQTIAFDMLLSFAASSDDPISRGRHKVLRSKALKIPPQTSTIASRLPKDVGAARHQKAFGGHFHKIVSRGRRAVYSYRGGNGSDCNGAQEFCT